MVVVCSAPQPRPLYSARHAGRARHRRAASASAGSATAFELELGGAAFVLELPSQEAGEALLAAVAELHAAATGRSKARRAAKRDQVCGHTRPPAAAPLPSVGGSLDDYARTGLRAYRPAAVERHSFGWLQTGAETTQAHIHVCFPESGKRPTAAPGK